MDATRWTVKSGKAILVQFPCVDSRLAVITAAQYNCVLGGGVDIYRDGELIFEGLHPGNIEDAFKSVDSQGVR